MFKKGLFYLQKKFDIDQAIIWSTLNKGFGFIKAPFSVYFIVKFLTPSDQGLWYTFGSLGALTVFAELGFTSIITQFISHEFAKLNFINESLAGDRLHKDRLFGLIKFSLRFYVWVIMAALVILIVTGYFYFKSEGGIVFIAWIFFSITGAFTLLINLLQSIYQGFDKVKEMQVNAFICSIVTTAANWSMLAMNWKIWALVTGNLTGLIVSGVFLYRTAPEFWNQVVRYESLTKFNFFKETVPLQIKYAISWISGYFIFNLYVPAAFKFIGQVEAGQLGITMSVITVIAGISNNWVTTKIPKFNILVSSGSLSELDELFKTSFINSIKIQMILSLCLVGCLFLLEYVLPSVAGRFLNAPITSLILLSQLSISIISALATYLRSHKEEPFVWVSMLNALLIALAIFFIMANYSLLKFFIIVNIIYWLVLLPLSVNVFFKRKVAYKLKYFNNG